MTTRSTKAGRSDRPAKTSAVASSTRLTVDVVSGDALPVAWIEVTALFAYPSRSVVTTTGHTDAEGRAVIQASHHEPPTAVSIWVGRSPQGVYDFDDDLRVVVEL